MRGKYEKKRLKQEKTDEIKSTEKTEKSRKKSDKLIHLVWKRSEENVATYEVTMVTTNGKLGQYLDRVTVTLATDNGNHNNS